MHTKISYMEKKYYERFGIVSTVADHCSRLKIVKKFSHYYIYTISKRSYYEVRR